MLLRAYSTTIRRKAVRTAVGLRLNTTKVTDAVLLGLTLDSFTISKVCYLMKESITLRNKLVVNLLA